MKSELSVEQFLEKLNEVCAFQEDIHMPNNCYANMMMAAPLHAAFCDENKASIAEATIIFTAIALMNKRYGGAYWYKIDEWVEHFSGPVLDYLKAGGLDKLLKGE